MIAESFRKYCGSSKNVHCSVWDSSWLYVYHPSHKTLIHGKWYRYRRGEDGIKISKSILSYILGLLTGNFWVTPLPELATKVLRPQLCNMFHWRYGMGPLFAYTMWTSLRSFELVRFSLMAKEENGAFDVFPDISLFLFPRFFDRKKTDPTFFFSYILMPSWETRRFLFVPIMDHVHWKW